MKSQLCPNLCIAVKVFRTKASLNVALPWVAGIEFEAFLHRTAEGILDRAVREFICEADRIVFEEESLDVTC